MFFLNESSAKPEPKPEPENVDEGFSPYGTSDASFFILTEADEDDDFGDDDPEEETGDLADEDDGGDDFGDDDNSDEGGDFGDSGDTQNDEETSEHTNSVTEEEKLVSLFEDFRILLDNIVSTEEIVDSFQNRNNISLTSFLEPISYELAGFRVTIESKILKETFGTIGYKKLLFIFTTIRIGLDTIIRLLEGAKKNMKKED